MAGKVYLVLLLVFAPQDIHGEASECNLCESLLGEEDQCAFLLDESIERPTWSCPPIFTCSPIITISFDFLIDTEAIELQKERKCRIIIIYTQNFSRYDEIFQDVEIFAPYSRIILLESGEEEPYNFTEEQTNVMYYNALHVLQIYQNPEKITFKVILSGLTAVGNRHSIPNITAVLPRHQLHPLIDNKFSRNEINVSLFHCPPFVVDKNLSSTDNDGTLDIRRFDGVEFILLAHITRRWKRRFYVKREMTDALDPASYILLDLLNEKTNVALCGLWLVEEMIIYLEVSHSYGQQCISLLVPRLPAVPRRKYIYLAFAELVWLYYIGIIVLISLLITYFVSINTSDSIPHQFNLLTESVMQVIAIATQHGINYFPRRYSTKILILAWIFFSFLIGAMYSTGYTSILTTTIFPKPISTIRDVLDRKIKWGDSASHLKDELEKSRLPEFMEFAENMIDSNTEEADKLLNAVNYAQAVSILHTSWASRTENFENISSKYRIMGECIYKFNTVFAFQRNSPYAEFFNKEIPKYVESGLIIHWLALHAIHYKKNYINTFFMQTKELHRGPRTLNVDNIAIGLYILGIGLALSTGIFIAELWYFNIRKRNNPPRNSRGVVFEFVE